MQKTGTAHHTTKGKKTSARTKGSTRRKTALTADDLLQIIRWEPGKGPLKLLPHQGLKAIEKHEVVEPRRNLTNRGRALLDIVQNVDDPYTDDVSLENKISAFSASVGIPKEARESFGKAIQILIAANKSRPQNTKKKPIPLPKKAPELFSERNNRNENIVDFMRRIWKPWLDANSINRSDLRRLDLSAVRAIENWLAKKAWPSDLNIPTKKEINDSLLAQSPEAIFTSPDLAMVYALRLRRKIEGPEPS